MGKLPIYGEGQIPMGYLNTVFSITIIAIVLTVYAIYSDKQKNSFLLYMWLFWVVAPPLWFSVEYFYLFKPYGSEGSFEALKYGQDVASKAWLAVVTVLTAFIVKK